MSNNSSNNKRIAKNTILLYVRMLLSIVVTLYTSRVVLQTLGVDDFGTYGVVGGIVSMFASLNASMSGATSRFITFAIGKGNEDDVNKTFSSSLIIHICIALLIVLLCETVGLWFLENTHIQYKYTSAKADALWKICTFIWIFYFFYVNSLKEII